MKKYKRITEDEWNEIAACCQRIKVICETAKKLL
jgi:hypothetical protein